MRNVIVTGGSRGIGLGIARTLNSAGYRAIAIARKETADLNRAIDESERRNPGSFHFLPFDLAEVECIPNLVKTVRRSYGPIYGLINNAGAGFDGVLATMQDSRIFELVRLNTVSPITLAKYVVRAIMADGGGGRIVNIASIAGLTGYTGLSVYSATKASLIGFTRSLAREVGTLGINVNAVAPGFIDTDMTTSLKAEDRQRIVRRSALRRLSEIDDVCSAVEFLVSEKAKNITGTVVTVDAGYTA